MSASADSIPDHDNAGLSSYLQGKAIDPKQKLWKGKFKNRRKPAKILDRWVCRISHRAREFHSKDEVEQSLEKHKEQEVFVPVQDVWNVFFSKEDLNTAIQWVLMELGVNRREVYFKKIYFIKQDKIIS